MRRRVDDRPTGRVDRRDVGTADGRGEVLRSPVAVLYDVRLAVLAVDSLYLAASEGSPWMYAVVAAALPLSLVPLRRLRRGGGITMPLWLVALDVVTAMAVLVGTGLESLALVYVGTTIAVAGLRNGPAGALLGVSCVAVLYGWVLQTGPGPSLDTATGLRLLLQTAVLAAVAYGAAGVRGSLLGHEAAALELAGARAERAGSEERLRLARDLHDSLSKTLHGTRLLLVAAREELGSPTGACRVDAGIEALSLAQDQTRAVLTGLRTAPLRDLRGHLDDIAVRLREKGLDVSLHHDGTWPAVPAEVADEYAHALSEVADNVLRHAHAQRVELRSRCEGDRLDVQVRDDGVGPPAASAEELFRGGHYGLIGVRERMARVGGAVEVGRGPHGGTEVRFGGPLRPVETGLAVGVVPLRTGASPGGLG